MSGTPSRIAIMLPRFSRYGGAEQFAWRLAEALAQQGHQVDFLCARAETEAPPGVRVVEVGRIGGLQFLKMLWFAARVEQKRLRGRYDLSISLGKTWEQDLLRVGGGPLRNFWKLSEIAYPAGMRRCAKIASRVLSPGNWLTLFLEKRHYAGGTKIVAVSHLVGQWIREAYPQLPEDSLSIVYNRPDLARFYPPAPQERQQARSAALLPENAVAVGVAATNFMLKGIGPLIQALALLPENYHLLVAGGRGDERYRRLAAALHVADRAHFLGKVSDMPAFYHALDIFALPTYYDACANVVVEALACGLRVMTSAVNGAAYFLPHEHVTRFPADPSELAERLRAMALAPQPAAFVWPEDAPAGMDAFVALVENELAAKRRASQQ